MTRRIGSADRRPRHQRSDIGKRRTLYKGKPTKGRKQIKFERGRMGNKSYLKIWVWERMPMSKEGRLRWNYKARSKLTNEITKFRFRHDVDVSDFNTQDKIEEFMEQNYWEGVFIIMGWSHGKNKYHVKPVKLCKLSVRDTNEGLRARMIESYRLRRYWFYKR